MERLAEKPILGLGVSAVEFPGSEVSSFELTYLQLLLNFGLVGFSLLLAGNAFLVYAVCRFFIEKHKFYVICPWIYGYLIYLVCAANNPILLKLEIGSLDTIIHLSQ